MGKLRALKLGITKGVQHVTNPYSKLKSSAILSVLHCLECGHASKYHTRRRDQYVNFSPEMLGKAIQETGFPGSRGFEECIFYHCDKCEEEKHNAIQVVKELEGCSA